jgi:hypothetical protein
MDHKVMYALCASLRPQICIESLAFIVIALKRNGDYADDIQVRQLGRGELFESECYCRSELLI